MLSQVSETANNRKDWRLGVGLGGGGGVLGCKELLYLPT